MNNGRQSSSFRKPCVYLGGSWIFRRNGKPCSDKPQEFEAEVSDKTGIKNDIKQHRWAIILLAVFVMGGLYWSIRYLGISELLTNIDQLISQVSSSGFAGPLIIVALMTLAVVFNPLPSAPIALAAGAVFGHTWGTVYIVGGAMLGAVIAFLIARVLGQQLARRLVERSGVSLGRFGSQNSLAAYIFISRLIPFISFDLVSYAAGLTNLALWRFVLATLFGLIPTSFMLAHFGGEMADLDLSRTVWLLLITGFVTLPLVLLKLNQYYRGRNAKVCLSSSQDDNESHGKGLLK